MNSIKIPNKLKIVGSVSRFPSTSKILLITLPFKKRHRLLLIPTYPVFDRHVFFNAAADIATYFHLSDIYLSAYHVHDVLRYTANKNETKKLGEVSCLEQYPLFTKKH